MSQKNESSSVKEEKKREWQSGIFGRFSVGANSLKLTINDEEIKDGPYADFKSHGGMHWDVLGYRSDSFWSISFFGESYEVNSLKAFNELKRSADFAGFRADFNFARKVSASDDLSQFYVGLALGKASATLQAKDTEDELRIDLSGSGTGLAFGYDYLAGKRLGFTVGVSGFSAKLDELDLGNRKSSYQLPLVTDSDKTLKLNGSFAFVGVLYNFDL